jgi:hypothetical protein
MEGIEERNQRKEPKKERGGIKEKNQRKRSNNEIDGRN